MGELQVADVRAQVNLSLIEDFEHWTALKPRPHHAEAVGAMLDQVIGWGKALRVAYRS